MNETGHRDDPSWLASRPVLIFDLGGVVLDWNPRYLFRALIPDEAQREWFLTQVCSPRWNALMDAGMPSAEAVAELSADYPEHAAWIRAYWERWPEMLGGLVPGAGELIADLAAAGRELYAITNFPGEVWQVTLDTFPVLRCFRDIVVSGFVGVCKPDPEIFALALRQFGVAAEDCLFIDDVAANVAGARAAGLAAVQFTSAGALRRLLLAS
ncbi:MAG TPA: HAD-IA family hydrolase [Streptosporangiaceae bacterium]|jgi:2-haloacid dehalogenase|nr:HAD-IA family hydrolase [Streptosporangiaceae bacterium]